MREGAGEGEGEGGRKDKIEILMERSDDSSIKGASIMRFKRIPTILLRKHITCHLSHKVCLLRIQRGITETLN